LPSSFTAPHVRRPYREVSLVLFRFLSDIFHECARGFHTVEIRSCTYNILSVIKRTFIWLLIKQSDGSFQRTLFWPFSSNKKKKFRILIMYVFRLKNNDHAIRFLRTRLVRKLWLKTSSLSYFITCFFNKQCL